jgi:hypothetical protein
MDADYLGDHAEINGILTEFVKGNIIKSTKEPRKSYMGQTVIDMSKIRMDFARNEINAATLKIIDRDFFNNIVAPPKTKDTDEEESKSN